VPLRIRRILLPDEGQMFDVPRHLGLLEDAERGVEHGALGLVVPHLAVGPAEGMLDGGDSGTIR